jgi:hypothetical protein
VGADRKGKSKQQKYSSKNIFMPPQKIIIRVLTHHKNYLPWGMKKFCTIVNMKFRNIFLFLPVTFG